MPNSTSGTPNATAAERATALLLARIPGPTATFKHVPVADLLFKDASGNVGIGTNSPNSRLEVSDTAAITSLIVNTDNTGVSAGNYSQVALADGDVIRTWWRNVRDGTGKTAFGYNDHLAFMSNAGGTPVERARIDSGGSLIVGRTTVFGGFGNEAQTGFSWQGGNDGYMAINNAGANGALYISRRSSASGLIVSFATQLTGTGSITTNGTTTAYNTTSDARLKHHIADAPDSADLIDSIKVRSFKWKSDNSECRFGFIAQELIKVAPDAVYVPDDPDAMMAVDYAKLVPLLVKEVQSLRARIAALETA